MFARGIRAERCALGIFMQSDGVAKIGCAASCVFSFPAQPDLSMGASGEICDGYICQFNLLILQSFLGKSDF